MSKYTIEHICGHTSERQLCGRVKDRQPRADYFASQDCPQCWGKAQREAEALLPITATIQCNGLDTDTQGNILAEIVLSGGTRARKDEIKAMGYAWADVRGGVLDLILISAIHPEKAWIKYAPAQEILAPKGMALSPAGEKIKAELIQLGAKIKNGVGLLDIEMIRKRQADKIAKETAIAAIAKPIMPDCYPAKRGSWNGKIYGTPKYGYRIYLDGAEEYISEDVRAEIIAYQATRETYLAAINI